MQLSGVIEGFYGTPWTWEERVSLVEWGVPRGLVDYVYAPKDDPKHRDQWREPYDEHELSGFDRLSDIPGARIWFAVSPGLSIDADDADDRATLLTKFHALAARGISGFVLAVDDVPPAPGLGAAHGRLAQFLLDELDGDILLVPTDYTSTRPTTYLRELAEHCPESVPIGWTGPTVVCDEITVNEAIGRANALGGRVPWLWDNYPVNDAAMHDRLFTGPLRGRSPELLGHISGYLANGGVQPRASRPALASIAAWLTGGDPTEAWSTYVDAREWRVFAEGCDGTVPNTLVDAFLDGAPGAESAVRLWLTAAAAVTAPGIDIEVAPWVEQLRAEAAVGLAILDATDVGALTTALYPWLKMARPEHTVLGPRRGFRPKFSQDDSGGFTAAPGSIEIDKNALDHLARAALLR